MAETIPWAWYLARASALVGFILLYLSIFLGLAIRTPVLKKIIQPFYSTNIHCWISLQALIFAALHGASLLFDRFIGFSIANITIPFYPMTKEQMINIDVGFLALGIIGFYLMVILVLTSYFRHYIPPYAWRAIHFLNIGLYIVVVFHALYLGTDLKTGLLRSVFIWANLSLGIIFLINLISRLGRDQV